jgi:hypothetical protein
MPTPTEVPEIAQLLATIQTGERNIVRAPSTRTLTYRKRRLMRGYLWRSAGGRRPPDGLEPVDVFEYTRCT